MAQTGQRIYRNTPFGIAVHPHVNKADAKFSPDNPVFKTGLRLSGQAAQDLKALIDKDVDVAFEAAMEDKTPKDRKAFSRYYPYEVEEDDNGDPTGDIVFHFKQNERIRLKSGEVKLVKLGIYDSRGEPMSKPVFGGSEIRVKYTTRTIEMKSTKQVGTRLDFAGIQVKRLSEGNSQGGGFGAVEDGYVDDGQGFEDTETGNTSSGVGSGDY